MQAYKKRNASADQMSPRTHGNNPVNVCYKCADEIWFRFAKNHMHMLLAIAGAGAMPSSNRGVSLLDELLEQKQTIDEESSEESDAETKTAVQTFSSRGRWRAKVKPAANFVGALQKVAPRAPPQKPSHKPRVAEYVGKSHTSGKRPLTSRRSPSPPGGTQLMPSPPSAVSPPSSHLRSPIRPGQRMSRPQSQWASKADKQQQRMASARPHRVPFTSSYGDQHESSPYGVSQVSS